jgi:hypothetical protein
VASAAAGGECSQASSRRGHNSCKSAAATRAGLRSSRMDTVRAGGRSKVAARRHISGGRSGASADIISADDRRSAGVVGKHFLGPLSRSRVTLAAAGRESGHWLAGRPATGLERDTCERARSGVCIIGSPGMRERRAAGSIPGTQFDWRSFGPRAAPPSGVDSVRRGPSKVTRRPAGARAPHDSLVPIRFLAGRAEPTLTGGLVGASLAAVAI